MAIVGIDNVEKQGCERLAFVAIGILRSNVVCLSQIINSWARIEVNLSIRRTGDSERPPSRLRNTRPIDFLPQLIPANQHIGEILLDARIGFYC